LENSDDVDAGDGGEDKFAILILFEIILFIFHYNPIGLKIETQLSDFH
jgi:hypothetical protein